MKIHFPYKVKNTGANTTYVEPIDQKDLDNLCDTLHAGYSRLVEMAIDNKQIFKQKCVPEQGLNRIKINKPTKIALKKWFGQKHPSLSVNPNPKNITGLKGQTFLRFINGNLNKLYRVKNKKEDVSEELLKQFNKMIDLIEQYIAREWNKQDQTIMQSKLTQQQIDFEYNQMLKFYTFINTLKIDAYNQVTRSNNNKNKQLTNTGLFSE